MNGDAEIGPANPIARNKRASLIRSKRAAIAQARQCDADDCNHVRHSVAIEDPLESTLFDQHRHHLAPYSTGQAGWLPLDLYMA